MGAIDSDLAEARRKTGEAATGAGAGRGGVVTSSINIVRRDAPPSSLPNNPSFVRPDLRLGNNFDETILRPASEGRLVPGSRIPKLTARKPKGHGIRYDEENVSTSRPTSGIGSGAERSAARGTMAVQQIAFARGEEDGYSSADGSSGGIGNEENIMLGSSSVGLQAMMSRRAQSQQQRGDGGGGPGDRFKMISPVRERPSSMEDRRRSLGFLRGRGGNGSIGGAGRGGGGSNNNYNSRFALAPQGGSDNYDDDEYDSDDESVLGDIMQKEHLQHSLSTHLAYRVDNKDDDGYDSDADITPPVINKNNRNYMDLDNHEYVRKNEAGEYIFDYDAMDYEALMKLKEEGYYEEVGDTSGRVYRPPPEMMEGDDDPLLQTFEYDYYFRDISKIDNPLLLKPTRPDSNAILPLKPHGPELDDFLFAMTDHPSKYAVMERKAKHPDSKREPRPTFPRDRTQPPKEFVNRYKGYLFVTGIVPHLDEKTGEPLNFDDLLHRQSISEDVAKLMSTGCSSMDVYPASPTSAYIGFATKLDAKNAMIELSAAENDSRLSVTHPIKLQKYEHRSNKEVDGKENQFVKSSPAGPDSILKVTGLPSSTTSTELFSSMFPPGSRLDAIFGPLTNDDYYRVSSTTALINLASSDLVSKALKSSNIVNNVVIGVGKSSIQVFRAKRERVFDNWVGDNRSFAASKLGKRLFVTGDVPPHEMYLSHHDLLHISGLPPTVTLDNLASFFQPYSADQRDVFGSGHMVRCSRGVPTGRAYVGFELPGEIDKVRAAYVQGIAILGGCEVTFSSVHDKLLRRGKRETARSSRTIDELRADLYDWERHVDPKDITELVKLGIDKGVLDEIMLTLRHSNRTFAAGDQSILGERLYEERQVGTHYRDAVRKYLKELKSCVPPTRDEPGLLYEAMFRPDQDVDTGLFDIEEERIRELRKKGI